MRSKALPWAWRLTCLLLVGCFVACPLGWPFLQAFREVAEPSVPPAAALPESVEETGSELARLVRLTGPTLALAGGTLLVAAPLGTALALLLFRTQLPARRWLIAAIGFSAFVPLPLVVSSWQALLGSGGLFPQPGWGPAPGRPWTAGLLPAIWIHGLAGLPWVVLIVGIGSTWVERELEEETLLATGPWSVLWHVTLPRCRASIVAAAIWVGVQTVADITVTDMLLVPTFAEEVHTRITLGGGAALARTLMLLLPFMLALGLALAWTAAWLRRHSPPLRLSFARPLLLPLQRRWPWLLGAHVIVGMLLLGPVAALIWRMGLAHFPPEWSLERVVEQLIGTLRAQAGNLALYFATAAITGLLTMCLALVACWWAVEHRWRRAVLLALVLTTWILPGPVLGLGIKSTIAALIERFPVRPLSTLLYHGPSPAPIAWAHLLRFFPFAVALLWPVVRLVPTELRDTARLEGASRWQEFVHVYWPLTRLGRWAAVLATTALALGEVGAAARVETPGWESFAKLLFDRMHYGVDREVASLGAALLVCLVGGMLLVAAAGRLLASRR